MDLTDADSTVLETSVFEKPWRRIDEPKVKAIKGEPFSDHELGKIRHLGRVQPYNEILEGCIYSWGSILRFS